jgi:phage gp29-like protein
MADTKQAAPPLPPRGAIVSQQALYMTQISLYRNSLAFGGTRNPSAIWDSMVYNMPQTMAYFRELEDKDEDVANALDTLKLSITERIRSVAPANEDDSTAVDVRDFIVDEFEKIDLESVLDCLLDAPGYGFSVQEIMFDVSAGQASLLSVEDCPQELFLFGNRFAPQIGNLQFLENPWMAEGPEVPEAKFIITSYRKRHRNRMGRPLLKSLFWPSWFKRNVQRLWMQYAEKGPGTAVTRYPDSDDSSERDQAVEAAQAIIDNVAIAIPENMPIEIELLKSARSLDPAVHEHLFKAMQLSITRRVLGETLTTFGNEDGRGSNAQGKTHADTFERRSVALSKFVMSIVNKQMVQPLVLWNYGPDAPMPKWTIETKEGEDLESRLQVDSGLQRMGKQFTVGYVADRYDVPLAQDEDPNAVLAPNVSAPQMPITNPGDASFSEDAPREQAHDEMREFDKVFAGLRKESLGIFRKRTEEIAAQAVPIARQ